MLTYIGTASITGLFMLAVFVVRSPKSAFEMLIYLLVAIGLIFGTMQQRKGFANDITRPQLWAVTDNVNQAKSDQSPDEWKPPLTSFYCTYAKSWVQVKSYYKLTITDAEKGALSGMLDKC